MAVVNKDAVIPKDAPKTLLTPKHSDFILKYGQDKDDYEYVMSEFLRMNGIYWGLTAMDLMHHCDKMNKDEVGKLKN